MNAIFQKITGMDWKQIFRLTRTLLVITVIAAFVLAAVNAITAGPIARQEETRRNAAMSCVMPEAEIFSLLYCDDPTIDRMTAAYIGTTFVGYCVEVTSNGFGGDISLMVGVNTLGAVTGVSILDHSETPGMGAKAESNEFLSQFINKSGTISIGGGKNSVQAVTNATITSKAVTEGVNTALAAAMNYDAEGGEFDV